MAEDVNVRPLQASEIEEMLWLRNRAFSKRQPQIELGAPDKSPRATLLGAWLGPRLVGALRLVAWNDIYTIEDVAVDPDMQDEGIGTQLMEKTERIAKAHGATQVGVHAYDEAVGFYSHLGYRATASDLEDLGLQLVEMRKEL